MNQPAAQPVKIPREVIWTAILDLHVREQVVTREVLRDVTGLKLTTIDEYVKKFIEVDECLRRVKNGVFQPVITPPPARAVSTTFMPDGLVKLEVGDAVLDLWPREARLVGMALSGPAQQFAQIQSGHEAGEVAHRMAAKLRRMERALADAGITLPNLDF